MHEKTSWQEDTALERYQMITPLLDDDIDEAERLRRRKKISEDNGISERTLYRYEKSYRESGFTGLKPADRTKLRSKKLPENFDELLSEAIQLKREVPKRSVSMIIDILEMEKRVAPGVLKRSTLQDHLFAAGYGRKQMNQYVEARNSSSKRFCKPHRMMLVQGDIKYGIYLPIGRHGAKRRTYLSSAIDDHSRYILYSHYYDSQEGSVVEDTFRHVIQDYGAFDKAYFDNGHQYTTSDPGCGKSTLIRKFAAGLDSNRYIFIYLSDSKLTPRWMYKGMLDQLGMESRFYRGDSKRQLQKQIEIIRKVDHKKVVCVLDEAHLLEKETIEEFRFLLNYHFDSMSPMALVLCGQTELWDEKLKLNRYAAVRQRIDMYCTLPHLTREETEEYIRSNLDYSGCGHEIFTSGAVSLIYDFSNGIMRVIDHLCSKSLMYAFQQQKHLIDDHMIRFVNDHEMITVGKAVS